MYFLQKSFYSSLALALSYTHANKVAYCRLQAGRHLCLKIHRDQQINKQTNSFLYLILDLKLIAELKNHSSIKYLYFQRVILAVAKSLFSNK